MFPGFRKHCKAEGTLKEYFGTLPAGCEISDSIQLSQKQSNLGSRSLTKNFSKCLCNILLSKNHLFRHP